MGLKHYRQHIRFLGKPLRGLHRSVNRSLSHVAHAGQQADNFLRKSRLGRLVRDELVREGEAVGRRVLDQQVDRLANALR